ncbi:MAG: hypothetical protein LBH75_02180 [Treponema sp.]|jgi:hypothetical protein|nr:hypothetical protein [Treponema sp.]
MVVTYRVLDEAERLTSDLQQSNETLRERGIGRMFWIRDGGCRTVDQR